MEILLKLYAIQSQDGKWFKSRGLNNYDKTSWVDTLDQAKIYSTLSPARSQVTFWFKNYPEYGMPKLMELQITNSVELNETERVKKSISKIEKKELEYKIKAEKWRKEKAERKLREAQKELNKINNK